MSKQSEPNAFAITASIIEDHLSKFLLPPRQQPTTTLPLLDLSGSSRAALIHGLTSNGVVQGLLEQLLHPAVVEDAVSVLTEHPAITSWPILFALALVRSGSVSAVRLLPAGFCIHVPLLPRAFGALVRLLVQQKYGDVSHWTACLMPQLSDMVRAPAADKAGASHVSSNAASLLFSPNILVGGKSTVKIDFSAGCSSFDRIALANLVCADMRGCVFPSPSSAASDKNAVLLPDSSAVLAGALLPTGSDGAGVGVPKQSHHQADLRGHNGEGTACLSVSPDGTRLLSGGYDGRVRLWNIDARMRRGAQSSPNQQYPELANTAMGDNVYDVAFSSTGRLVAAACRNSKAVILEGDTLSQVSVLSRTNTCYSVSFSADESLLAVSGRELDVTVYSLLTGNVRYLLVGHINWVYSVAFSPTENIVATGGRDYSVRIWKLDPDSIDRKIRAQQTPVLYMDQVYRVAWSSCGTFVISATCSRHEPVVIRNVLTGSVIRRFPGSFCATLSSAFPGLAAAAGDDGLVRLASFGGTPATESGVVGFGKRHSLTAAACAFSRRGDVLFSGAWATHLWAGSSRETFNENNIHVNSSSPARCVAAHYGSFQEECGLLELAAGEVQASVESHLRLSSDDSRTFKFAKVPLGKGGKPNGHENNVEALIVAALTDPWGNQTVAKTK